MHDEQIMARAHLKRNAGAAALLLILMTWGVFLVMNQKTILLRTIQRGCAAANENTLRMLTRAAIDQFPVQDQFAVLDILQADGRDEMAAPLLRHMTSADNAPPGLHLRLADTLSGLGQHEQADTEYIAMLDSPTDITEMTVLLRMAQNANHAGWYDKAIDRYQQYLTQVPDDKAARSELAGILLSTGRKAESLQEYRLLASSEPQNAVWLLELADAALTEPDPTARASVPNLRIAREALEQALTLDDACATRKRLAVVLSWLGEHERVLDVLKPCDPPDLAEPELCRAYAQAISATERWTPQEREIFIALGNVALAQSAPEPKLLDAMARAIHVMNDNELAARLFLRTLELNPANRAVRFEFANLLHEMKRYEEADIHYQMLLDEQ